MTNSAWLPLELGAGLLLPLFLPLAQFGVVFQLWSQHKVEVDRLHCHNNCWDAVAAAGRDTAPSSYHHLTFNTTWQAGAMWCLVVVSTVALHEAVKYLVRLWRAGQLRWRMALLFLSSVYPHYYSCWGLFNYLNDDFYSQLGHQILFAGTEFLSTLVTLQLATRDRHPSPDKLLIIVAIGAGHAFTAGWDQFVGNVFRQEGSSHQETDINNDGRFAQ